MTRLCLRVEKGGHVSFFQGKRVLITGGSSGIGLAAAQQLNAQGAELILVARDVGKLREAKDSLLSSPGGSGAAVELLPFDLADKSALVEAVRSLDGPVDILINNAGITRPGNFLELPEDCFESMMRVNYLGAVELTRLLLPPMIEKKQGSVAFVSSLLGLMGIWGYTAYAASKFAVRGFAECLRSELKPHNVSVTVCYPPDTDTPQHEGEKPFLPPETVAQAGTAGLLTADYVAECLLAGIADRRFEVIPGLQAKFAATMNRLAPGLVHSVLDWDARKAQQTP